MKAFHDFKNKQKSVWSNVFWYVKVCRFWNCIQYTIHWDKTQMLKKNHSDKINGTKNAFFSLSRAPTHHSFTFNLQFLCELKHKVRLSKTVWDIPFLILFRFYFCSTKCMDSSTLKRRNFFQNENNRKATHSSAPRPLIFKLQQEVLKLNGIFVSWSSPKLTWWQIF